jgi:hypothetical protein
MVTRWTSPLNSFQPYRITVKRITTMQKANKGNKAAMGRPATGRNYALSVRVSKEAKDIVDQQENKSEFIDNLIKSTNNA